MSQNGNSESVDSSLEGKELAPWLVKRFADLALPLSRIPTIRFAALSLIADSGRRHRDDATDTLAGRAVSRRIITRVTQDTGYLPLRPRLASSILRKQALVQTKPGQPSSQPLLLRHRRPDSPASHEMHAPTRRTPSNTGGSWPEKARSFRQAQSLPISERDHPVGNTTRGQSPLTEQPTFPSAGRLPSSSVRTRESPDVAPGHTQVLSSARALSSPPRVERIAEQNTVLEQTEDVDASPPPHATRSRTRDRAAYMSKHPGSVDLGRSDDFGDQPAPIRPQRRYPDLTRLASRVLMPILQRTRQQQPSVQDRGSSASGKAGIGPTHTQEGAPFTTALATFPTSYRATMLEDHALPRLGVVKRPPGLLTYPLRNLPRSLSEPGMVDGVAGGSQRLRLQGTPDAPDMSESTLPGIQTGRSGEASELVAYRFASRPTLQRGDDSHEETAISRPIGRRNALSLPVSGEGGTDRQLAEAHAVRRLPYGSPGSIVGPAIIPASLTRTIARAVTATSRHLFRPAADAPVSQRTVEHGFPVSPEHVPSSTSHPYLRRLAPTLPVASFRPTRADSGAAGGAELFRYTSGASPHIRHDTEHNGLELALAPQARRTAETGGEAAVGAPESRVEKGEEKHLPPDLKALAREIYPHIKRMIMIERDRHPAGY